MIGLFAAVYESVKPIATYCSATQSRSLPVQSGIRCVTPPRYYNAHLAQVAACSQVRLDLEIDVGSTLGF